MKKHNAVFNQWKSQNKTQRDLRLIASLNCLFDSKRFLGNNVFASVDKYYIKRIIRNIRSDRAFRQLFFRDYSRAIYLLRDYLKYVEATENLEAKNVTTTIFADKSVTEATTDNNTVDANEKKETKPDLVDDSAELVTEVFVNVETSNAKKVESTEADTILSEEPVDSQEETDTQKSIGIVEDESQSLESKEKQCRNVKEMTNSSKKLEVPDENKNESTEADTILPEEPVDSQVITDTQKSIGIVEDESQSLESKEKQGQNATETTNPSITLEVVDDDKNESTDIEATLSEESIDIPKTTSEISKTAGLSATERQDQDSFLRELDETSTDKASVTVETFNATETEEDLIVDGYQLDVSSFIEPRKEIKRTDNKKAQQTRDGTSNRISDKKLLEHDKKKYRRWERSVTEVNFIGSEIVQQIVEQLKELKNKYSDDIPLGLVYLPTSQYVELKKICAKSVISQTNRMSQLEALIISMTMVQFCIYEKVGDNFWDDFFGSFGVQTSPKLMSYFSKALLSFCVSENLYFCYENGKRKYVETLKTHSIVSKGTLTSIMANIEDYYTEMLHESYNANTIDSYIEDYLLRMKQDLESGMASRYLVPIAYKTACKEFPQAMRDCIDLVLFNTNSYRYKLSNYLHSPISFNRYFNQWILEKRTNKTNKRTRKSRTETRNRSLFKPTFFLNQRLNLYLFIPKMELNEKYADCEPEVVLYNGVERIGTTSVKVPVFGTYKFYTDEIEIKIPDFYHRLSVKMFAGNEVVFDSDKMLYRDYMVFNESRVEHFSRKMPDNGFFLMTSPNDDVAIDGYYDVVKSGKYRVYSMDLSEDSLVTVNTIPVFRTSGDDNISINVLGKDEVKTARIIIDGTIHYLWRSYPRLFIKLERGFSDDYSLWINQKNVVQINDSEKEQTIDLSAQSSGKLSVVIKKNNDKVIWEYNFFVAPHFQIIFDKELYYNDADGFIEDFYADNIEIGEYEYPIAFDARVGHVLFDAMTDDGIKAKLQINIPSVSWTLGKINSTTDDKYIMQQKIAENGMLQIHSSVPDLRIFAANRKGFQILKNNNGRVNLSAYRFSSEEYTNIGIVKGKIQIKFFEIIHKPCIREFHIDSRDNGRKMDIQYLIFGDCSITISLVNEEAVYTVFHSSESDNVSIDLDYPDGRYEVRVELSEADEFGFGVEPQIIETIPYILGDPVIQAMCQNSEYQITQCNIDGALKRIKNFYIEELKTIVEGHMYEANACYYKWDIYSGEYKKAYFRTANPVILRLFSINENVLEIIMTDKEYDGFLYNKISGHLISDDRGLKDKEVLDVPDLYIVEI